MQIRRVAGMVSTVPFVVGGIYYTAEYDGYRMLVGGTNGYNLVNVETGELIFQNCMTRQYLQGQLISVGYEFVADAELVVPKKD